MTKFRLDKFLMDQGKVRSRSQATAFIHQGVVSVNGQKVTKPGHEVDGTEIIEINAEIDVVGRGAYKLEEALKHFKVDVKNKVCLDIGASTGGFTQILLRHHAQKIYAIDVGHDQLAPELQNNPQVINMEGVNVRHLTELPEKGEFAVVDLSFISLKLVLNAIKNLLTPASQMIVLIKPQFEAGKERVGKLGLIRSDEVRQQVMDETLEWLKENGHPLIEMIDSPITGKEGNKEYLALIDYSKGQN